MRVLLAACDLRCTWGMITAGDITSDMPAALRVSARQPYSCSNPTHAAATRVQERKRQLDGAPKGASQHQQPDAAARWGNAGGPTSAPKRQEGGHGSQYGAAGAAAPWGQPQGAAGAADDPIEVDDGDGGASTQ
jgi:hypothetical protein